MKNPSLRTIQVGTATKEIQFMREGQVEIVSNLWWLLNSSLQGQCRLELYLSEQKMTSWFQSMLSMWWPQHTIMNILLSAAILQFRVQIAYYLYSHCACAGTWRDSSSLMKCAHNFVSFITIITHFLSDHVFLDHCHCIFQFNSTLRFACREGAQQRSRCSIFGTRPMGSTPNLGPKGMI